MMQAVVFSLVLAACYGKVSAMPKHAVRALWMLPTCDFTGSSTLGIRRRDPGAVLPFAFRLLRLLDLNDCQQLEELPSGMEATNVRRVADEMLARVPKTTLRKMMDCKKPETFFQLTDFTGSDIVASKIPAGSSQTLPSDYKCGAALGSAWKDKPSACSGFKNVATASDCCLKCSQFPACQYWSYGSSGSDAKYARIHAHKNCTRAHTGLSTARPRRVRVRVSFAALTSSGCVPGRAG
jgi:hypothetical protein